MLVSTWGWNMKINECINICFLLFRQIFPIRGLKRAEMYLVTGRTHFGRIFVDEFLGGSPFFGCVFTVVIVIFRLGDVTWTFPLRCSCLREVWKMPINECKIDFFILSKNCLIFKQQGLNRAENFTLLLVESILFALSSMGSLAVLSPGVFSLASTFNVRRFSELNFRKRAGLFSWWAVNQVSCHITRYWNW